MLTAMQAVSACLVLAGSVVFRARNRGKSAQRAQQVTLGAAVFDSHGRILVDPDGLIPSTVVTDSFLEKVGANSHKTCAMLSDLCCHSTPRSTLVPRILFSTGCSKHLVAGTALPVSSVAWAII